jgi:outer membrane protein TolC
MPRRTPKTISANRRARRVGWLACALALAGCSTKYYRQSADKAAYREIAAKSPQVQDMQPQFTIAQTNVLALDKLPLATHTKEFLGQAAETERGARVLSLDGALDLAVKFSRSYQNNKELLYLSALSLTLSRHQFTPIFSASGKGDYAVVTDRTVTLVPDPANPGQTLPLVSDNIVEKHSVSGSGSIGVDWLIRDVGRISAAFTTDFLRFLSGGPGTVAASQVGATFSRPLLRNSGFKVEVENLTQAERNLLYQLRDFVRFRKDFSVQVAAAYYGVIGNLDATRNSYLNLQSSRRSAERARAMAAEGRQTQTDLGRLEQQVLSSESTWIGAVRTYQRALDDFKLQLGIPTVSRLVLDQHELENLQIQHPDITPDAAIQVALAARLDYQNVQDAVADSQRQVKLAADRFKPQVDFVANAGFLSPSVDHGFALPDTARHHWDAGLNLDLPLERTMERNHYRSALIAEDRAGRAVEQLHDQIELQIRDSWRTLEQARRSYEISEIGVKLAERRVEEQELLAEFGRAKALDQVDAENALLSSKDQRTQALVAHTIARLQFWDNMGILYIKENGQWENFDNAKIK